MTLSAAATTSPSWFREEVNCFDCASLPNTQSERDNSDLSGLRCLRTVSVVKSEISVS